MSGRVIVSLTSLPSRFEYLTAVIKSLSGQTLVPDRIVLWLCPYYKRLGTACSESSVPSYARRHPLVDVRFTEDLGPITKLLPTMREPLSPDDVIVVLDDDHQVPRRFVEHLVTAARQEPAVFGYRGRVLTPTLRFEDTVLYGAGGGMPLDSREDRRRVDIFTVTAGIAFQRRVIPASIFDFWRKVDEERPDLVNVDDIWLSTFLNVHDIDRFVIKLEGRLKPIGTPQYTVVWRRGWFPWVRIKKTARNSLWAEHETGTANDHAIACFSDTWRDDAMQSDVALGVGA